MGKRAGNIFPLLWPLGPGKRSPQDWETQQGSRAAQALFPIPAQQIPSGSLSSPVTHRYTDFAQDFLRNSFGFFQYLIQRATILK